MKLTGSSYYTEPVYLSEPYAMPGRSHALYEPPTTHSAPPSTIVLTEHSGSTALHPDPASDRARRGSM